MKTTNTQTAHTPGPWIAKELHANSNSIGSAITNPIKGGTRRLDDGKGAFRNEDARLIAAAPELLAALHGVVGSVALLRADLNMDAVSQDDQMRRLHEIGVNALRAIDKVEAAS